MTRFSAEVEYARLKSVIWVDGMDDLGFGLWMALFGMGIVFALLLLLVFILWLIGLEPKKKPNEVHKTEEVAQIDTCDGSSLDPDLMAAIIVAVGAYRSELGEKAIDFETTPKLSRWQAITRSMQHQHLPLRAR